MRYHLPRRRGSDSRPGRLDRTGIHVGGYDSPPNTSLSCAALRQFLLPYRFRFAITPWTGRCVTFQPIPVQLAEFRRALAV